nr:TetR/AcrR family transcriptional regulator [Kibdelosporangium sp. MJ126-NF4]CEL17443.1 Transcriptional regulator, TetR family [Kibdelosporangium sp. MJ126-NF4]CTQ91330.1 Transcriptional regulator, TetR family [Kibdelosporangium sp. MJ126-NF4]
MTTDDPTAPARGTRPRNRRTLVLAAATRLFTRRGFDRIAMSDIAEAVDIRPSALYRHFTGKQDLLREVLTSSFAPVLSELSTLDLNDRTTALPRLAALALDHRHLGVLWQREARHLAPTDRDTVRDHVRRLGRHLTPRIEQARPELSTPAADLLAWSTIAVLDSLSFHHLELPRPHYDRFLADLVGAVLDTSVPDTFTQGSRPPRDTPGLTPRSRREALLAQAIRMFAEHGYTSIGIDDIAAAVGIAGPSIYKHFTSKQDLLTAAFSRGIALLFANLATDLSHATDPTDGLHRLLRTYIHTTLQHHDLVHLMITEMKHLPDDDRRAAKQAQHEYVREWTHLLHTLPPTMDPTTAQIRVQAALTVANNAARSPHLRDNPAIAVVLHTLCTRLLIPTDGYLANH